MITTYDLDKVPSTYPPGFFPECVAKGSRFTLGPGG